MAAPQPKSEWFRCAACGAASFTTTSSANRARRIGAHLYCDLTCAGVARRKNMTDAQKKEAKRLYDIEYRRQNLEALKAKKREQHKATYDPAKAAIARKARMAQHVEYCRQPSYKAWKRVYDADYRSREYGDFAEAYKVFVALNKEIKARVTQTESRIENGTFGKAQTRRREAQALGRELEGRPVAHPPSRAGR